ncbi:MAG: HicB family protein [Armatimonadetes bacterium CG_4_10_14_3_um_filter_66_18]|nr:type II toxin-antitoxin system HicB family antitoxin [Armatimonadota bacterium]OIO98431.1 MAG: HicB family protein [Armatimonadetes bacterium CG2_30_66_41]PIU87647.1 MAG: HicB family protein [Armatimonadetes bacterium CG06_land_8_20_14_3_00_66_21]PIW16408.1 MAG: HicB family protein [Armatimonadetes bacterium CG17_big_fil_post_rev_8_21_14_2_50_66_6]PIX48143.1 MAG: HicB family protein [Armatimonadetes bacterium CG_4_8_14_3_um_filter_66_20]PIY36713.1 MAG: HicB family protein [Armatimonadetes b
MERLFTLTYWVDDGWYVGRLVQVPGVVSQGETLDELENNLRDAYSMMVQESPALHRADARTEELALAG